MPPADPASCPNCTSPQRGVRYSDDPGALCADRWHDTPADPAPDSHEPAGRVDVPGAAPEWAVKMARDLPTCGSYHDYNGECCDYVNESIARLLASVRESALREAAKEADAVAAVAPRYETEVAYNRGARDTEAAILSLIAQPPKEAK